MVVLTPRKAHGLFAGFTHCQRVLVIAFFVIFLIFAAKFFIQNDYNKETYDIDAIDDYIRNYWHAGRSHGDFNLKKTEKSQNLVCYYNIPDGGKVNPLLPKNLTCDLCTHINIGFATVHNNSIVLDNNLSSSIADVVNLKKCNDKLKVLLSIGGASSGAGFSEMVQNHANRKVFIGSIRDTLKKYRLDGIDLDWEFPATDNNFNHMRLQTKKRERQHFSQLLREIRVEYYRENKNYLLTLAVASVEKIIDAAYDVSEINQYVDFVNLMTYDFHFYSKITPYTGFNAPLFKRTGEMGYFSTLNINSSIYYWLNKGLDRNKLVIGVPTYGHNYNLVNSNNGLPGSPANGYGKLGCYGFVDYTDVCKFIVENKNIIVSFDNETFSPYAHLNSEWISYENEQSIMSKVKYIRELDLGGVMVYSLNSDDHSGLCSNGSDLFHLTQLINKTLYNIDSN